MNIDWLHLAATVVVVMVISEVLKRTTNYSSAPFWKRFLMLFLPLIVALGILNVLWPFGPSLG